MLRDNCSKQVFGFPFFSTTWVTAHDSDALLGHREQITEYSRFLLSPATQVWAGRNSPAAPLKSHQSCSSLGNTTRCPWAAEPPPRTSDRHPPGGPQAGEVLQPHVLPPCCCRFSICTNQRVSDWYSIQARCIYWKPWWPSQRDLQDRLRHHGTGPANTIMTLHSSWAAGAECPKENLQAPGDRACFSALFREEEMRQRRLQHCTSDACHICSSSFTEYAALRLFSKL